MSYSNQVIEWDVPRDEVQFGVPVGYEVELSQSISFNPRTYLLSTFNESIAAPIGVFFYSLDNGETWVDYPSGQGGQAFYAPYKMRVFVNVGYANDFFVEKEGILYRVTADGSKWTDTYNTKRSGFSDLSIDLKNNVIYLVGSDEVGYKVETDPTLKAAVRSINLHDEAVGIAVDGSRGSFWQVDHEKVHLKGLEGDLIVSIELPEPIDVDYSSSSSTSTSSESGGNHSSSSSSSSSIDSSSSSSVSSSSSTSLSSSSNSSSSSTSLSSPSSTSSSSTSSSNSSSSSTSLSSSSSSSSFGYSTSSSSSSTSRSSESSSSTEGYSESSSTSACEGVCEFWRFDESVGPSHATGDIYPDAVLPPEMQRASDCALRIRLYYSAIGKGPAAPDCPNMPPNTRKIWVYTPDGLSKVAETICEPHNNPTADLWVQGTGYTVHWGSITNMTCGAIFSPDVDFLAWADCIPGSSSSS